MSNEIRKPGAGEHATSTQSEQRYEIVLGTDEQKMVKRSPAELEALSQFETGLREGLVDFFEGLLPVMPNEALPPDPSSLGFDERSLEELEEDEIEIVNRVTFEVCGIDPKQSVAKRQYLVFADDLAEVSGVVRAEVFDAENPELLEQGVVVHRWIFPDGQVRLRVESEQDKPADVLARVGLSIDDLEGKDVLEAGSIEGVLAPAVEAEGISAAVTPLYSALTFLQGQDGAASDGAIMQSDRPNVLPQDLIINIEGPFTGGIGDNFQLAKYLYGIDLLKPNGEMRVADPFPNKHEIAAFIEYFTDQHDPEFAQGLAVAIGEWKRGGKKKVVAAEFWNKMYDRLTVDQRRTIDRRIASSMTEWFQTRDKSVEVSMDEIESVEEGEEQEQHQYRSFMRITKLPSTQPFLVDESASE